MPKVLVLFDEADQDAAMCGESAAEGARGVRFTEVDVRVAAVAGTGESRQKVLESPTSIDSYDAVVIATGKDSMTSATKSVVDALSRLPSQHFTNTVFGAARSDGGELAGQLAGLGGIAVAQDGANGDPGAAARDLGARVAKLAGWVRHSLSHEEADGEHGHDHDRHHHHHHAN